MPQIHVELACPVHDSFRVQQIAGLFDLSLAERAVERFSVEVPELGDDWRIGMIVGPSGSGKSSVARRLFGSSFYETRDWPHDQAVIDGFGERSIREITAALVAVGFGSPPSWLKPYHVLSGGERFRADLARALVHAEAATGRSGGSTESNPALVVFDEFTSVVDRQVAQVCSAAVAKAIRSGTVGSRFVAVTCHHDVTEWLAPDWVLDMGTRAFSRRRLRRPAIELELHTCGPEAWSLFARHHYLSTRLSPLARCFLATWRGAPAAFCATLSLMGHRRRRRISRLVTLPDYQGIGIGGTMLHAVAALHHNDGSRVNITTSHPAILAHCRRAPHWRAIGMRKTGVRHTGGRERNYRGSVGRAVVSFEYVPLGSEL
ncbi:MAG: GNAT family N-acetyltransferase [Planctomycetota bacterium]